MDLGAQPVGPVDLQLQGAARLDALTGGELDVLPNFGADGKEFGVAEVITHAFEQFIGTRIKGGFFVCRRDGQGHEAHQRGSRKSRPELANSEINYSVIHISFFRKTRWFFRFNNRHYASGVPDRGDAGKEAFVGDWQVPKCPIRKVIYRLAGKPLTRSRDVRAGFQPECGRISRSGGRHLQS